MDEEKVELVDGGSGTIPAPTINQDGVHLPHPTRGMDSVERPDHHKLATEREAPGNPPVSE